MGHEKEEKIEEKEEKIEEKNSEKEGNMEKMKGAISEILRNLTNFETEAALQFHQEKFHGMKDRFEIIEKMGDEKEAELRKRKPDAKVHSFVQILHKKNQTIPEKEEKIEEKEEKI